MKKIIDMNSQFIGDWQGTYRLILSWLPEPDFVSASNMEIKSVANGKFLVLNYDWKHEGIKQDGLLLMGNHNKNGDVTASWVDSFGMGAKIMNCFGAINKKNDIIINGLYEVPDSPDWGWRIEIPCPTNNALQIIMYNITPDGKESLAIDANYTSL